MNFRRIIIVAIALILLPLTFFVSGGDFGKSQSLFSDIKAHKVGDNITIMIFEDINAIGRTQTKNEESGNTSVSGGPMTGALDFLPLFGASTSNTSDYSGKGELRKTQRLRAKMTVTVVSIKENGDLVIEGRRSIGIGPNMETLYLSGVVRQKDVTSANTVDSYQIADATIVYDGTGPSQNSAKPGILSRLMGWLF